MWWWICLLAFILYFVCRKNKSPEPTIEFHEFDAWEGSFFEASDPKELSLYLSIEYTDAEGKQTVRKVQMREFDASLHGGILMGHCELRNETRTFRFDRIKRCVDLTTGEVIEDIKGFFIHAYEQTSAYSVDVFLEEYGDFLKAAFFVAKADGQCRKEEKLLILKYMQELVNDPRISIEQLEQVLRGYKVPSLQAFKLAVGRFVKAKPSQADALKECAQNIVNTQKAIHPSEQAALEYITKKVAVN